MVNDVDGSGTPAAPSRAQTAGDLALAVVATSIAVAMQLNRIDAVPANRGPDPWSVLLTVAALLPLAVRRRYPLATLVACFPGFVLLIAGQYSVAVAPVGVLIAFYTVAAWDTRRNARLALGIVAAGYALALALRPVDLSVEGTVVQAALLVGGGILGAGTRSRRDLHAAQVADAERRAALDRERAVHAATEERLRISRELHDVLGHAFSVMVVQAGVAEHVIDSSPADARRALAEIRTTGRASMTEMRRLLHVLREGDGGAAPARDPSPSLADVPDLVARVRAAGLPVEFRVAGTPGALSPGLELAAFRVIQEALTNSIKHARASQAKVRVTHADHALTVEIRDDGAASGGTPVTDGHGIAGMRERVAMYGGDLVARATPDGYLVLATLQAGPA